MKTYDQRVKDILIKAKRRKIVGTCLKTVASTLCLVAIIVGLMHIPYRTPHAGVGPTDPGTNLTQPPTVDTIPTNPTLPTVPNTTGPVTHPTEPDPSTYPAFEYEGLRLDGERVKLIEESWAEQYKLGFSNKMKFCDPASGVDGIRYYGSFTKENYKGEILSYDILYIPCQALPVASEFTFGGHTFRSWNCFGLYVFVSEHLGSLDITMNTFYPLATYLHEETGVSTIEEDVLLSAVQMHRSYESLFYGSALTEMPQEDPRDHMLRLKAAWLANKGYIPIFNQKDEPRYYGTFSGYDIVLEPTEQTIIQTQTIGGQSFTHSSSFVLYAIKDWQLYLLEDVYEQGLISQVNIEQLAQIHREPIDKEAELAKYNALFGELDSWYNQALTSEYATPEQLVLSQFFLNAFCEDGNEVTDSERAQLKDLYGFSDFIDMVDITRLPVDRMNEVLQEYFGITLDEFDVAADRDLDYLESTDCYYIIGGGASGAMDFKALSFETLYDGSICVYYTADWEDTVYAVTIMPTDDGYRIISNVKVD